jgi:indolepyruvate decarboxylase
MGRDKPSTALYAETVGTLVSALRVAADTDRLTLIEVVLPELDVPPLLGAITQAVAAKNAGG